ncbi:MAG: VOC family protein [Pseudomonadota bacterium]
MQLNQITVPADDVPASVAFYKQLGFRQLVDSPPDLHIPRRTKQHKPA